MLVAQGDLAINQHTASVLTSFLSLCRKIKHGDCTSHVQLPIQFLPLKLPLLSPVPALAQKCSAGGMHDIPPKTNLCLWAPPSSQQPTHHNACHIYIFPIFSSTRATIWHFLPTWPPHSCLLRSMFPRQPLHLLIPGVRLASVSGPALAASPNTKEKDKGFTPRYSLLLCPLPTTLKNTKTT